MHVLSVSSLKGGVGKTTVALGIASAALSRGLRTLVVDLDPQSDATTALGATRELKSTCAEVLRLPKHDNVHKAIVASDWESVSGGVMDLLPGSAKSVEFDSPTPTKRDLWRLEEALSRVELEYDLVIIDTPPSLNGLTQMAWTASDKVLIVAEPSIFSVLAADRAMRAVAEISRQTAGRLQPLGVLINRYIPASKEHQFRFAELGQLFGSRLLRVSIEEHSAIQQAQGAARPIHSWPGDVAHETAQSFEKIMDAVFEESTVGHNSKALKRSRKAIRSMKFRRGAIDTVLESAQPIAPELDLQRHESDFFSEQPTETTKSADPIEEGLPAPATYSNLPKETEPASVEKELPIEVSDDQPEQPLFRRRRS